MIVADPVIAERYAQAFFAVSKRQGVVADLVQECEAALGLFAWGSKLSVFLESPQITTEAKQQMIDKVLKSRVHPLLYQLLGLLLRKRRIDYLRAILKKFKALAENDQGIYEADVATAGDLDGSQRQALQSALERFAKARLKINFRVDPSLIGGVRFIYGDTLIDDSVKGKLYKLRQQLEMAAR